MSKYPFGRDQLAINRGLGRMYHNPLGWWAFKRAALHAHLAAESRVLDVGAGRGIGAVRLARAYGCRIVGIDTSRTMIDEAESLVHNDPSIRARFHQVDILRYLPSRPFDLICCFDVLGFVPRRAKAYKHLAGLLRRDGVIAVSDYTVVRHTRAVKRLVDRWRLKSVGSMDDLCADVTAAGLKIDYSLDTTKRYHDYWMRIRNRLRARWDRLAASVGDTGLQHYRSSVEAIIDATEEGSFGHVFFVGAKAK